jgi:hypothetical protein
MQAQLGVPRQVQLHMGAIQQLLDICRRKGVYLSDGIKRAIFWWVTMQYSLAAHTNSHFPTGQT